MELYALFFLLLFLRDRVKGIPVAYRLPQQPFYYYPPPEPGRPPPPPVYFHGPQPARNNNNASPTTETPPQTGKSGGAEPQPGQPTQDYVPPAPLNSQLATAIEAQPPRHYGGSQSARNSNYAYATDRTYLQSYGTVGRSPAQPAYSYGTQPANNNRYPPSNTETAHQRRNIGSKQPQSGKSTQDYVPLKPPNSQPRTTGKFQPSLHYGGSQSVRNSNTAYPSEKTYLQSRWTVGHEPVYYYGYPSGPNVPPQVGSIQDYYSSQPANNGTGAPQNKTTNYQHGNTEVHQPPFYRVNPSATNSQASYNGIPPQANGKLPPPPAPQATHISRFQPTVASQEGPAYQTYPDYSYNYPSYAVERISGPLSGYEYYYYYQPDSSPNNQNHRHVNNGPSTLDTRTATASVTDGSKMNRFPLNKALSNTAEATTTNSRMTGSNGGRVDAAVGKAAVSSFKTQPTGELTRSVLSGDIATGGTQATSQPGGRGSTGESPSNTGGVVDAAAGRGKQKYGDFSVSGRTGAITMGGTQATSQSGSTGYVSGSSKASDRVPDNTLKGSWQNYYNAYPSINPTVPGSSRGQRVNRIPSYNRRTYYSGTQNAGRIDTVGNGDVASNYRRGERNGQLPVKGINRNTLTDRAQATSKFGNRVSTGKVADATLDGGVHNSGSGNPSLTVESRTSKSNPASTGGNNNVQTSSHRVDSTGNGTPSRQKIEHAHISGSAADGHVGGIISNRSQSTNSQSSAHKSSERQYSNHYNTNSYAASNGYGRVPYHPYYYGSQRQTYPYRYPSNQYYDSAYGRRVPDSNAGVHYPATYNTNTYRANAHYQTANNRNMNNPAPNVYYQQPYYVNRNNTQANAHYQATYSRNRNTARTNYHAPNYGYRNNNRANVQYQPDKNTQGTTQHPIISHQAPKTANRNVPRANVQYQPANTANSNTQQSNVHNKVTVSANRNIPKTANRNVPRANVQYQTAKAANRNTLEYNVNRNTPRDYTNYQSVYNANGNAPRANVHYQPAYSASRNLPQANAHRQRAYSTNMHQTRGHYQETYHTNGNIPQARGYYQPASSPNRNVPHQQTYDYSNNYAAYQAQHQRNPNFGRASYWQRGQGTRPFHQPERMAISEMTDGRVKDSGILSPNPPRPFSGCFSDVRLQHGPSIIAETWRVGCSVAKGRTLRDCSKSVECKRAPGVPPGGVRAEAMALSEITDGRRLDSGIHTLTWEY